jgi:hypothetical protein
MTTPNLGGFTVVQVTPQPVQVAPPGGQGATVQISNLDTTYNIYISTQYNPSPNGTNVQIIGPFASVVLPNGAALWGCSDANANNGNGCLTQVTPGGSDATVSPYAIAESLFPLAALIAEEIYDLGVPLVGAPELLYDNTQSTPPGTPGLVGATISNHWFPSGTSPAQAITLMNGYVGLPLGNIVERSYYGEGNYPQLTDQPLASYIAAGAKIQLCLKPQLSGLTNPTVAASEKANIVDTINLLNGANVTFDIVLYTEANLPSSDFTSASQYIDYIALYGPSVRTNGVKLIYNPASYDLTTAVSYYAGDSSFDVFSWDYYGTDWKDGILPFATSDSISNLPKGVSEWNAVSGAGDQLTLAQFQGYTEYIISYFSTRLSNSETNWDIILYTGYNASALNQILSNEDWKIPQITAMYNALSAAPPTTPGLIINGGAFKNVPPVNPTPGGGYAMANGVSYDITITATANAAGSTNPFLTVQFNWFNIDALGAITVAAQHWQIPIGVTGGAGTITQGFGPQHGQYLQIKIGNRDTEACTVTLQVNSTSRGEERHNWYWDAVASVDVPGFTTANTGSEFSNSLISLDEISIPANSTDVSYLMSLFAGQVQGSFSSGAGGNLIFLIIPQPVSVMGGAALYDQETASASPSLILPRAPCLLNIQNPNDVAVNAYAEVVILD